VHSINDVPLLQNRSVRLNDQLLKGFPVFGTSDQFSLSERTFFPDLSVTSVVMVPVLCEDRFWGFIQGIYFNEPHDWTEYEISSMQIAADVISTMIESGKPAEDLSVSAAENANQPPDPLMEAAVDLVFVADSEGKIIYMNRTGLEFFGMEGDPASDVPSYDVFTSFVKRYILTSSAILPALPEDGPRELELPVGEKCVYLELTLSPVSGNLGSRRLFMGIARDVSRQKNLQKKQHEIQKKLQLMQKIVRHDLNNQITAVMGYLYLLKKDTNNPEFLKLIEKEERIVDAIRKSLSFTKVYEHLGDESAVWIDINEIISAAWTSLGLETIHLDLPGQSLEIFVDPLFRNVISNLLDNSLRHGGKNLSSIHISILYENDDAIIVYEDNGAGILLENKEKIFDRGFYINNGFGLLLSREILSLTGLSIRETGIPGKGARFEITVPTGMWRQPGEHA
jgi:PAS domain S-box-containing protein